MLPSAGSPAGSAGSATLVQLSATPASAAALDASAGQRGWNRHPPGSWSRPGASQRRLAAARLAGQRHDLAGRDIQVDPSTARAAALPRPLPRPANRTATPAADSTGGWAASLSRADPVLAVVVMRLPRQAHDLHFYESSPVLRSAARSYPDAGGNPSRAGRPELRMH